MAFFKCKFLFFLDIFEHNSKGIFKLLDDACKIQLDFVVHFLSCWTNSIVRKPKPKEVQSTGFTIRHFAGDVVYQTVSEIIFFVFKTIGNIHIYC